MCMRKHRHGHCVGRCSEKSLGVSGFKLWPEGSFICIPCTCVTSDFNRASNLRMRIVSLIFSFSKRSMSAFKTCASCVISVSKYLQKCDIFVLFPRFCTSLQNRAVCYWKSVSFRHGRQPTRDKIQLLKHCPAARLLALGSLR